MKMSKLRIKFFGSKFSKKVIKNKINHIKSELDKFLYYLIIAGTNTSQIQGISAAGIDPKSRQITALADAEFLLFGPTFDHKYKLPLLTAGVSPALISNVCADMIKANLIVIPLGLEKKPYFKHLVIEKPLARPAKCLSSGKSMTKSRVKSLYEKGLLIGRSKIKPIVILESVPGGTTTAQAIMEAHGLEVSDLVGSSLLNPPRKLKKEIILKGLNNANLDNDFDSIDVISALGDPFQAFSMGLLIGARDANQTVILCGGSQMIAVLLLALEYVNTLDKQSFVDSIFIATTGWLLNNKDLNNLLGLVAEKHNINLLGLGSCLNFESSQYQELRDYEIGYVKEGVGAGGMSILAYLNGFNYEDIISKCEYNLEKMR